MSHDSSVPYLMLNERKSRRTHKNSRDGCPNCKAKRIKCSEELPSCLNCIKKNYRCGYLDFPAEKLEIIQRKNTAKHLQETSESLRNDHSNVSTSSSSTNFNSVSPNSYTDSPNKRHHPAPYQDLMDNFSTPSQFPNISTLRKLVYKSSFLKVGHDLNDPSFVSFASDEPEIDRVPGFKPWTPNESWNSTNEAGQYHDVQYLINESNAKYDRLHPHQNYHNQIVVDKQPSIKDEVFKRDTGLPLLNAIRKQTVFPVLVIAPNLRNNFLKRFLDKNPDIREMNNQEFAYVYAPVWTNKISDNFWITVFNQSVILNVYFSFFMDRSLNFLITRGKYLLDEEKGLYTVSPGSSAPSLSPRSAASTSDPTSPDNLSVSSLVSRSDEQTAFNQNDLGTLTKKSFTYYGLLIRDLRESISNYHLEYPTKISLFSAWSSFIHLHSTVDSLSLMYTGTALLFSKIVNEAQTTEDITPTILVALNVFDNHASWALVPDYHFDVVHEIHDNFKQFKALCLSITDPNYKQHYGVESDEYDIQKFLNDKLFKKDMTELEKFIEKLVNEYYPALIQINSTCKARYGKVDDTSGSIHYISFSLLFELLSNWFQIFSSDALSIGPHLNPFKKTMCLFYNALGRAIVHTITPVRSIMMVDACHVFCPRIDFDSQVYQFRPFHDSGPGRVSVGSSQSQFISNLSRTLLRMVKFFDARLLFYAYSFSHVSVMQEGNMKHVEPLPELKYKDVLVVSTPKFSVREKLVTSFSSQAIKLETFPQFEDLHLNPQYKQLINREQMRFVSEKWFDYTTGFTSQDFQPGPLLAEMRKQSEYKWRENLPDIHSIRRRVHNFEQGRREIKACISNIKSNTI